MSQRKAALFVQKSASRIVLSKFVTEAKGGDGTRFSSAGWFAGNGIRHFLGTSRQTSKKPFNSYANYYLNVRGFRSGKKPPGESTKPHRTNLVPALEDSGSKMADRMSLFIKPISFTAFVAGASFVGTTIWSYEAYTRDTGYFSLSGWKKKDPVRPFEIQKVGELRHKLSVWWSQLPPGGDVFWAICGANTLVWLAWRAPALSPFMVTYFTASPISKAVCLPMLLSVFSHFSLLHLVANMFVLHSFMPSTVNLMGREQFVGFYLTAGVVSSLGSHLYKIVIGSNVPSLGASGAVMGILGYICTRIPDSQLGIIFLPGFTFSADTALKCILAVDTVGMLAGWRFMDHAAHLSGCLFGIAFSYFESSLVPLRDKLMKTYHQYRDSSGESGK